MESHLLERLRLSEADPDLLCTLASDIAHALTSSQSRATRQMWIDSHKPESAEQEATAPPEASLEERDNLLRALRAKLALSTRTGKLDEAGYRSGYLSALRDFLEAYHRASESTQREAIAWRCLRAAAAREILLALAEDSLTVCKLADKLQRDKSQVSKQLARLRAAGLLDCPPGQRWEKHHMLTILGERCVKAVQDSESVRHRAPHVQSDENLAAVSMSDPPSPRPRSTLEADPRRPRRPVPSGPATAPAAALAASSERLSVEPTSLSGWSTIRTSQPLYQEQKDLPTQAQRQEVERLAACMRRLREAIDDIRVPSGELRKGAIDLILAMSDEEASIALLRGELKLPGDR